MKKLVLVITTLLATSLQTAERTKNSSRLSPAKNSYALLDQLPAEILEPIIAFVVQSTQATQESPARKFLQLLQINHTLRCLNKKLHHRLPPLCLDTATLKSYIQQFELEDNVFRCLAVLSSDDTETLTSTLASDATTSKQEPLAKIILTFARNKRFSDRIIAKALHRIFTHDHLGFYTVSKNETYYVLPYGYESIVDVNFDQMKANPLLQQTRGVKPINYCFYIELIESLISHEYVETLHELIAFGRFPTALYGRPYNPQWQWNAQEIAETQLLANKKFTMDNTKLTKIVNLFQQHPRYVRTNAKKMESTRNLISNLQKKNQAHRFTLSALHPSKCFHVSLS